MTCQSFPGPGIDHLYTFNPMREFIEGYTDHVDDAFEKYKKIHDKDYDDKEYYQRKETFRHNLRYNESLVLNHPERSH